MLTLRFLQGNQTLINMGFEPDALLLYPAAQ